jgi:hypothetical protein
MLIFKNINKGTYLANHPCFFYLGGECDFWVLVQTDVSLPVTLNINREGFAGGVSGLSRHWHIQESACKE